MNTEIDKIRNLVVPFRNAIEICKNKLGIPFCTFPKMCCGVTSVLLGYYLLQYGFNDVVYVLGDNKDLRSHAWIEIGEIIIDITATQFNEIHEDVIVDHSKNLPFYKSFNERREILSVNIEGYDENSKINFLSQYKTILKTLKKNKIEF